MNQHPGKRSSVNYSFAVKCIKVTITVTNFPEEEIKHGQYELLENCILNEVDKT